MFFKINFNHQSLRSLILFIVVFLTFFNLFNQLPRLFYFVHILKTHHVSLIGREFAPLSPYLKGTPTAGYMTCLHSSNPLIDTAIMGPYQQAQFVLSPTILDYFHPLDYRAIIYQCPDEPTSKQIHKRLGPYMIFKSFKGVSLLFRMKGL
ncbi:MAG: hypothetical protein HQL14_00165 [Candidatus Omnitrophica bacterium]|nr:hypothetical protein [Candidatus Omnitrophota bacterium]